MYKTIKHNFMFLFMHAIIILETCKIKRVFVFVNQCF